MSRHLTTISARDLVALANDVIEKNGVFWFHSRGYSMEPGLGDGELVAVAKVAVDDIRVGDVLLCNPTHKPVLHRVACKSDDAGEVTFTLKSDVGNQIHHVTPAQVVGRLVAAKRSPARLARWYLKQLAKAALQRLIPHRLPSPDSASRMS